MNTKQKLHDSFIFCVFMMLGSMLPGCIMVHEQIIPHTFYTLLDLKVEDGDVLCLLKKQETRSELSVMHAIMSEPSKTAYSSQSVALLSFGLEELMNVDEETIEVKTQTEVIHRKSIFGNIHLSIINGSLLFGRDVVNDLKYFAFIELYGEKKSYPLYEDPNVRVKMKSLDNERMYYTTNDTDYYVYFIKEKKSQKLEYTLASPDPDNANLGPVESLREDLFIEYVGEDASVFNNGVQTPYKVKIVNTRTNQTYSNFMLPSYRLIYDYQNIEQHEEILSRADFRGIAISDTYGNVLHYLSKEKIPEYSRAMFYEGKVIAAGTSVHHDRLGDFQYIDIFIWDYKNDKLITKSYRCGRAGL